MTAPLEPLYATEEEIAKAKERLKAKGVLPTIGRNLKALGAGLVQGTSRAAANLLDLGGTEPLPSGGKGGMGRPRAVGETSAGADLAVKSRGVATKAGKVITDTKEQAREMGALRTFGLPFTDAELTDVGTAGVLGNFGGAALPYMLAGAVTPEAAVPAALARFGRMGTAITRGATQAAVAAPLSVAQARTREESTLGAVADMTGNETLQRASKSPALRLATELGVDLLGNTAGEAIGAARAAKRAKPVAAPIAEAVAAAPVPAKATGEPIRELWTRRPAPATPEGKVALEAIEAAALADPSPTAGKLQVTTFSDGTKVGTRYRVVDRAEVAPSHDAFTWQLNPEATPGLQGRSYDADPGAQSAIARGGLEYDADRALNPASSPEEGPPIVSSLRNGNGKRDVVAGNARVLMFDRATAQRPDRVGAYREALRAKAAEFGIDPAVLDGMREPMLVRELVDPDGTLNTPGTIAALNNLSDRPATKVKSRGDEAATRAANLTQAPDALEHFGATFDPDETLGEYLRGANGREFFGKLIDGGVIAPEESRGFLTQAGELDDIGRGRLQDMLRASVLGDPRLAERGGAAVKKLDGAIPSLALIKMAGPEWDVAPSIAAAVDALQQVRGAGLRTIDELVGQGDLLGGELPPDVVGMARFLEATPARELQARFRSYATAAREAADRTAGGAGDLFPGMAASPEELRQTLFSPPAMSAPSTVRVPRETTQAGLTGEPLGAVAASPPSGVAETTNGSPSTYQVPSIGSRESSLEAGAVGSDIGAAPVGDTPKVAPARIGRKAVPLLKNKGVDFSRIGLDLTPTGRARIKQAEEFVAAQGGSLQTPKAQWQGNPQTLEELAQEAAATQPVLVAQAQDWAQRIGLDGDAVINPGAKTLESMQSKIARGKLPSTVGDAARASIVVQEPTQFRQLLEQVKGDGWLVQADDFNASPTAFAYGALHLQLRNPATGAMAELQLHTPQTWQARYTYGLHDLYDLWESKDAFQVRTAADKARFVRDLIYAQSEYLEATRKFLAGEPAPQEAALVGVHFRKEDPLRGRWYVAEPGKGGKVLADDLDGPAEARAFLADLQPVGAGGTELRYGGVPREVFKAGANLFKGNKAGAIGGAAIGAGTADEDENPLAAGLRGAVAGAFGQATLRTALRALSRPAQTPTEAATSRQAPPSVATATRGPADRVAAMKPLEAEIPARPKALEPVAESVTAERPELLENPRVKDRAARGYFNVPRLNLPVELQDQLANRVVALAGNAQGIPKRVITNAETQEQAAKILGLKTPAELAAIDWKRMNGAEGVALASLVGERTRQIDDAVTKLRDPALGDAERVALEGDVTRLDAEANDLLSAVMKGASQQGRDLQANKILANLRSPEAALIKAQRMLGSRVLTPTEKTELLQLVNQGDQAAVASYIAELRKASLPEQLVVLRKAGLLTSVKNRVLDLTSNAISLFEQQGLSKPVQVATDFLLSKQTGQRTRFLGNRDLYRAQVSTGLRQGLAEAIDAMGIPELTKGGLPRDGAQLRDRVRRWIARIREVKVTPEQLEKYGIPKITTIDFLPGGEANRGNRLLDAYMKASFQSASVADKIMKTAAYRGAMTDAAESLAHAERTPAGRLRARVEELVAAPTDEMIAAATLEAERITFMNSEWSAKFANQVKVLPGRLFKNEAQKAAANAVMDFLFPFVKTGANIGARITDYAGLAGVRSVIGYAALRKAIAEGADPAQIRTLQREVATLVGRASSGALAMYGVGLWAYDKGLVTGAMPGDAGERAQWQLEGKTPNSVLIGDEWMPIARMTPLGAVVAAGANLGRNLENRDLTASEKVFATATATSRTALDQPLVTGTKTLLDAAQDTERFGQGMLRSTASSLVPTAVADVAKALDDGTVRKPTGASEAIQERLPIARGKLPAKIDALGQELRGREGALDIFLNPFGGTRERSSDPITALLRQTGARVTPPRQEKGESAEWFEARSRLEGQSIRDALADMVRSGELQGLDPDEQVRAIDDVVRATRRDVRDQLRDQGRLKRTETP